jgi:hypothetical protein
MKSGPLPADLLLFVVVVLYPFPPAKTKDRGSEELGATTYGLHSGGTDGRTGSERTKTGTGRDRRRGVDGRLMRR